VQNVILALGQGLVSGDLNQLGKAIAGYVANGDFYTDNGAADAYVLTAVGGKQAPPAYTDGMRIRFTAANVNTGASTVNVAGLGVKNLKALGGVDLGAGDVQTGNTLVAYYNGVDFIVTDLGDTPEVTFTTGDAKLTLKDTADTGWVLADDGTIGSAGSGASNRANADTEGLYTLLWNNISDTYAPVTGGRGASAAADFAADKPIQVGTIVGRALGVGGAGSGLTARALGEALGAETHQLTISEMPAHTHDLQYQLLAGQGDTEGGSGRVNAGTTGTNQALTRGGDTAHNNMQPTSFMNVMIKL
jgi:hypothetical protein